MSEFSGGADLKISAKPLRVICACVLLGILVAGLWPFHSPKNEVTWVSHGNGLRFGKYGTVVSAGLFQLTGYTEATPAVSSAGLFQLTGYTEATPAVSKFGWNRAECRPWGRFSHSIGVQTI